MTARDLNMLFSPGSIAVIGASRKPGKVGHEILENLIEGGFPGTIVPVNPNAGTLAGMRSYTRLGDFDGQVDMTLIALPHEIVPEAVRDSIKAGAKSVVVVSAGFRERGREGWKREEQIRRLCSSRGVRLLGPNCLGIINTAAGMNASFAGPMPGRGGIAVFSQSGAVCSAMIDEAARRNLGLSKVASIGNKADLTEVDFLHALGQDEETRVIVGFLEDIRNGDDFIAAAEEVSAIKPVIIMKAGTTGAGRKAASSHTGVLGGAEIAYGAAFRRSGVIRADRYESLFDCAAALSMQPLPQGKRVLVVSNAGGPGIMTADAVERSGLVVSSPGVLTSAAMREQFPVNTAVGGPVSVLGDAEPARYAAAMESARKDSTVDAVIVVLTPRAMTRHAETVKALAAGGSGEKPVLAVFMGGGKSLPAKEKLAESGIPLFESPERAVATLGKMEEYASWKRRPPRVVTRFRVNRRKVERIITRRIRVGRRQIEEVRAKDILCAYGFRIPAGGLSTTSEEAVETAERIGYPVAMKIVSHHIVHKSDLGGVKLNLSSREEVEDAFDLMILRIGQRAPEAMIEGVYVEKMLPQGLEIIIGMSRDPQFGPMLMFGLGGIFVEVMKDVTFNLAPITADEAIQMLTSTRSYEILSGARGQRAIDLTAIATGLQRISQLATDFPGIVELDINPFMIGEFGTEPYVIDARITLKEKGEAVPEWERAPEDE